MLTRMAEICRKEGGSVAILVVAAITAIMGLAALGTDVGRLYVERQRLMTVVDAAALSGAQKLPGDPAAAVAATQDYLQKNGIDPSTANITVSDDGREVHVEMARMVPLTFARVLGVSESQVSTRAVARTDNLSGYYGAAPLGVPEADWQIGQQISLKLAPQDGTVSPGNYQALALGRAGASSYENNLMYGYPAWLRAGDWVDTETGNMAGPTVRAVNYRIDQDPFATWDTATRQSPRLVVVPILESFTVKGKGQVHVVGFGTFFLEQAIDHGNDKGEIIGRFVRFYAGGEASPSVPDFGVYSTKLIE